MKTTLLTTLTLGALLCALGCSPAAPAKTETPAAEPAATEEPAAVEEPAVADPAVADATADPAVTDPAAASTDPAAAAGASPVWTPDEDANATVTPSGLKIITSTPGEGPEAAATNNVVVNYTGWLTNGTAFDSNTDPQFKHVEPFALNAPWGVIEGWKEGLVGMKKGEVRKLYIPANLAYGPQSPSPLIPANSDLIFQVEMLEIK